jgi:predicted transcriptional regulator
MRETLTIRLSREQASWLEQVAKRTGRSQSDIVREQLERARQAPAARGFLRLAGAVEAPPGASARKGFSRR